LNPTTMTNPAAASAPQLWREPGFALLLGSLFVVRVRGGEAAGHLRRPLVDASRATPLHCRMTSLVRGSEPRYPLGTRLVKKNEPRHQDEASWTSLVVMQCFPKDDSSHIAVELKI